MRSSILKYIVIAFASFVVGLLLRSSPKGSQPQSLPGNTQAQAPLSSIQHEKNNLRSVTSRSKSTQKTSQSSEPLYLRRNVVEALLRANEIGRMLPQMGLDEKQVQAVLVIKNSSFSDLKDLESRHAKLESDEEGDYYSIHAFPEDHDDWMADLTQQLRDVVDDDRAVVISKLIIKSQRSGEIGLHHRNARILAPKSSDGDSKIKESFFDENREWFDTDYRIYRGVHETRWDHLFKP